MIALNDSQMITRIRAGEKELFNTLMEKYYEEVYRFCYYKTSDESISYDCTQDTFLNLVKYINTYVDKQKFKAYLFSIARNTCNDYFRKNTRVVTGQEYVKPAGMDTQIEHAETAHIVQKALNQLPDIQKDVIILRFYYDFKVKEIARIVGVGLPTAKSRLKQGMDKLKSIFKEEDFFEA